MFRIGDFSRLSQVSVKALRFYDEMGLLKPTYIDRDTGYRYYSATLLPRLNRILAFKELGFSLAEIVHLLEGDLPVDHVRELLQSRRAELARRIERERAQLIEVEAWLAQIDQGGRVPDYEVAIKQVAPRLIASVRDSLSSYGDADDLFDELHSHLKHRGAPLERGAIWHTCANQKESIDCEAIVFLREPARDAGRTRIYELPGATVACVIHQGSDETFERAYRAARSWIKSHGYAIAGPNREVYWRGGVAHDDDSGVTEIQYPIILKPSAGAAGH
ncbi:MAG TPA: MerR family transcriptional regulator [Blastocatellia bacterium]|nr:MerR family transcriptional regulator [Blastocatellia bacterium]